MRRNNTEYIVKLAALAALAVLLNIFTITVIPNTRNVLSFIYVPCFVAGIFMGPIAGLTVGFVGDLLGYFIAPQGDFMPLVLLASTLVGLIPGLVFKYLKGNTTLKITLSFILCYIICTAGLNTFAVWDRYFASTRTFFSYLLLRLPFQTLNIVANFVLVLSIYESNMLHALFKRGNKIILKKKN